MRKFGILAILAAMLCLSACNGIKKFGQVVQAGGEAIEGAATAVQNKK